jgi:uncharacterized protein (TIGR03382 family)
MGVEGGNWQAALSDPGRLDMMHVRDLFESRAWYRLVPDIAETVLTSGYSNGDDRAAAALTDDGETLIVYAPSRRTLTVNMNAISGSSATAWWFNPRDGSVDAGTAITSSSTRNFTPPTNDDWVLVIDDDASALPAPGSGTIDPDPDPGTGGTAGSAGTSGGGAAGSGGTVPYVYVPKFTCSASMPGQSPTTLWYLTALGAWVWLGRRRRRVQL